MITDGWLSYLWWLYTCLNVEVWGGWQLGTGRGGDGRVCGRMGAKERVGDVRGMGGCWEMGE